MSTSILKTHYRRSATVLTSEQIEEIRHLKNKVPAYMIVKEYHINKNRVYDIWNSCERYQQNENHFLEELKKVQSISLVPPSENNLQEKQKKKKKRSLQDQLKSIQSSDLPEISAGGLYQNSALDISQDIFASIKKDRIESEEAIRESEKFLALNPPFHYIQTKNTSQGSH